MSRHKYSKLFSLRANHFYLLLLLLVRDDKNVNISIHGEDGVGQGLLENCHSLIQLYQQINQPSLWHHELSTRFTCCKPVQLNTNFRNLFPKIHVIISFPFSNRSSASKTWTYKNSITVSFVQPTDWPIRGLTTLFQQGRQHSVESGDINTK